LLRTLALNGRASLSEMARLRGVSRQGVQRLADGLARDGLVRVLAHPRNRRVKLLELTPDGMQAYLELARREAEALNALAQGLPAGEMRTAARVLQTLGERSRAASARRRGERGVRP
jgi:DNA-binding MarR family transcriptional regulator